MDKLKEIFKIQKKFTEHFFRQKFDLSLDEIKDSKELKIKWNKEYILSLIVEATEILNEIDWKMHRTKHVDSDDEKILEESIDMLKYLLGLFIINGFTVDDIYNMFMKKSEIVEKRFEKESKSESTAKSSINN